MSKSPSLRRIQADIRELSLDPSDQYYAAPLESDMHEWHFTIRGAPDTDFAGGIYHGRILLPPEYPFKPPHIVFLTPSGRFETHTKICLSFSAFHPELWQPAWGIRLILEALIAFLPSPADGAIGALDWSSVERKRLAAKSVDFCCPSCGKVANLLPELKEKSEAKPSRFQKEIEQLRRMQTQEHITDKENVSDEESKPAASASSSTPVEEKAPSVEPAEKKTPELAPSGIFPTVGETSLPAPAPLHPAVEQEDTSSRDRNDEPAVVVESATTQPVAPAVPDTNINNNNNVVPIDADTKPSWLVEPALQMAIVVLSGICFLLLRKIQALCAELQALEE
eukprot:scaffold1953_cov176-Amphora_coffeaeformis.AAC.12